MQWINNKHGPGFDAGFPMTGRPRDGTGRKSRDKTILRKGSLVIRYFYLLTRQIQDDRTHSRPSSKWRTTERSKPAFWTSEGEVYPLVKNYGLRITNEKRR